MAIFNTLNSQIIPADSVGNVRVLDAISIMKQIDDEDIHKIVVYLGEKALHFLANIFIAIVIYYVGRWILKKLIGILDKTFEQKNVELSVRSFTRSIVKAIGYIFIILTIVQLLGVNTTSLVAMLASAGLAVGMALSGTLQNFAGGVMVLFLKPYRIGDYITAQGESGTVKEIMLFTTVLETPDRHTIFVPNSSISSSIIDNASYADTRRVDWSVGISYGDSVADARKAIIEILGEDKRIFGADVAGKAPMVGITALADSSVNLTVRAWVTTADYWNVYFETYEKLYEILPKRGVNFPFPQLDVNIKK